MDGTPSLGGPRSRGARVEVFDVPLAPSAEPFVGSAAGELEEFSVVFLVLCMRGYFLASPVPLVVAAASDAVDPAFSPLKDCYKLADEIVWAYTSPASVDFPAALLRFVSGRAIATVISRSPMVLPLSISTAFCASASDE